MLLKVEGPIQIYYVQTLCLLFFPGATFAAHEPQDPQNPYAHVVLHSEADRLWAEVVMRYEGREAARCEELLRREHPDAGEERLSKIVVGRAVFAAGQDLLGRTPPWGILTGVRPSKVASELIFEGGGIRRSRQILRDEYFVHPKKAALAVSVASTEIKLTQRMALDTQCSVYISIPFCPSRCAYCSFVSNTSGKLLSLIGDYLQTLYRDIDNIFAIIGQLGLHVASVYIGGGTPTVLTEAELDALLSHISHHLAQHTPDEFTLEAGRPDTITREKLALAHAHGVTRISVNPQTLSDPLLAAIGRRHTVEDFYRAYDLATASGIRDINVDLIAGLPGDDFENFASTMDAILGLSPTNITVHSFSVKRAADMRRREDGVYTRPDEYAAKSVDYAQLRTKIAGYRPYYMYRQKNTVGNLENVGYAREGHEGMYNIYMMEELHSIFAAGAGAVTKLVRRKNVRDAHPRIERIFTPKYPYEYLRDAEKIRVGDPENGQPSIAEKIRAFYGR